MANFISNLHCNFLGLFSHRWSFADPNRVAKWTLGKHFIRILVKICVCEEELSGLCYLADYCGIGEKLVPAAWGAFIVIAVACCYRFKGEKIEEQSRTPLTSYRGKTSSRLRKVRRAVHNTVLPDSMESHTYNYTFFILQYIKHTNNLYFIIYGSVIPYSIWDSEEKFK